MKNKLTNKELKQLAKKLEEYEWELLNNWGLKKISGGFVNLEMKDYDEDSIYIEAKSGIDGERTEYEDLTLNRETLEFIN